MAYFWAWLVETDRKKKKRSPRRSRRPVAGKAVTRDRRVYGCCSLAFATVMTSKSLLIFSTVILDGLAGLSGGLLSERWLIRHQAALTGFAAGAILGAVFLDILPESVREVGPRDPRIR